MANWTTVSSTVLEIGKPIRSIDITAIKENITAVPEKAAGAPVLANNYVVQAMINAAAVGQGQLKTTTASGSTGLGGTSYSLTGGTYSWWTASSTPGDTGEFYGFGGGNTAAGVIGLFPVITTTGPTFHVDERYVQASPPYNLGHGDIAQFFYVMVGSDGAVRAVSVGADPTWAYHGQTDIRPERYDRSGKAFRRYRMLGAEPLREALRSQETLRRFMAGELQPDLVELEITHEIKNRDMNAHPHPWSATPLPAGCSVVLLDPTSSIVDRLALICTEENARRGVELVEQGYLSIGNTPLEMNSPTGVMPVAVSWKT